MAEIRIENLNKTYGAFTAVRDSGLTVRDGEFFVMLGPSGCGKTTTLRLIAGLEFPSYGRIFLDGEDVTANPGSKRDIAFVFQLFALYPHMNVEKNLSFPLRVQHLPRRVIRDKVAEVANMLRITHLLKSPVGALSSGDRQRVALGRALVREAKAFLMDEPLGALDAEFRDLMCGELRQLHDRVRATTVYVTHDQVEAMSMADRICIMDRGEILQVGSPLEVYARPATRFVAGFIGSPSMNFLPAKGGLPAGADCIEVAGGRVQIPRLIDALPGDQALVGVRPEHLSLSDDGALRGRIFAVEYMGAKRLLTVDTACGRLRLKAGNRVKAAVGDNVGLNFARDSLIVFDAGTGVAVKSALYDQRGQHAGHANG
ncbi:MAG: ABC transporter ATP-binding protein [Gammaproteobacteria bacterium]|nr:ABC transporter ATP-binding protein [Gammaproteobacteria bacterium]